MSFNMQKYIDVLTPAPSGCPYFIVDISQPYVPVLNVGYHPYGVWGTDGIRPVLQVTFQNRDNLNIQSIGMFFPENFTLTNRNYPLYDNTLGNPVAAVGLAYTALVSRTDANGSWVTGHSYLGSAGEWIDIDTQSLSPTMQLFLCNSAEEPPLGDFQSMPGFGSSNRHIYTLPFPNYELVTDLYSDIANFPRSILPNDDYVVMGNVVCPDVSMVGVPVEMDGRLMRITPFVKIAHTVPISGALVSPVPPPEPPEAEFDWRDEDWEEHGDPHGDEYHTDPIDFPTGI